MATSKIQLIYHEMRGRTDSHIRMLEEAGQAWEFGLAVPGPNAGKFRAFGAKTGKNFAPPYMADGEVVLTQTIAITKYIGEKCGFTKGADPNVALQYMLDIDDLVNGIFKAASATPEDLAKYMTGRGAGVLAMINEQIAGPFYFGANFTYVDFLLCSYVDIFQAVYFGLAKEDMTAPFANIASAVGGIRALKSYQNYTALPLMKDSFKKDAKYASAYLAAKKNPAESAPALPAAAAGSDELELTYFDGPGRAELIRLILKAGDFKFKDTRLSFPEWGAIKQDPKSAPNKLFGALPIIGRGDFRLGQSRAIQSYAADVALPNTRKTAKDRAIDTMFQNTHSDAQSILYKCLFGSDDSKAAATKTINEDMKGVLSAFERLVPGSGFIKKGDQPSAADLSVFDIYTSVFPGVKTLGVKLDPYPKSVALVERIGAYSSVAAYVKERGF